MKLLERKTAKTLEAVIEPVGKKEFAGIFKDKIRFPHFDWRIYKDQEVYKIRLSTNNEILGLMCITDHIDVTINAIEIELLEVAIEHMGSRKQIDHVAGCLIAYACRESFKRSHDGFVFLVPKTKLIQYYQKMYGFAHIPFPTVNQPDGVMVLNTNPSARLIKQYLE